MSDEVKCTCDNPKKGFHSLFCDLAVKVLSELSEVAIKEVEEVIEDKIEGKG